MRKIDFIVVHTGQPDRATILNSAQESRKTPALHYHISLNGNLVPLAPKNKNSDLGIRAGAQCICVGVQKPTGKGDRSLNRTQEDALFDQIVALTERHPGGRVVGKEHFDGKAYSSQRFDVRAWLASYVPDLDMAA